MQFPIDAQRLGLIATGTVRPLDVFGQQGVQQVNDANVKMWEIDAFTKDQEFGKEVTKVIVVRLPSPEEPKVAEFQRLMLEHPEVSFYASKGQLRVNVSAAGLARSAAKSA